MANLSVHPTGVSLRFTPAGDFSEPRGEINIITSFVEIAKTGKSGK